MNHLSKNPPAWANRRAWHGATLFALALFGYPTVGNLVSLLQIDSRVLSVPFRIAVGLYALWLLGRFGRLRLDMRHLALLLIWLAFALRLLYDDVVTGIEGADYALQFFVAGVVLPALALWKLGSYDQRQFARAGFVVAATGCLLSLVGDALGGFRDADLTELTGRLSTLALNPISLGHLAVSGLFCGAVLWRETPTHKRASMGMVMVAMLFALFMTGSKGPALALVVVGSAWAVRCGSVARLIPIAVVMVTLLLLVENNPLLDRLAGSAEDLSTLDRIILINDSLQQIAGSPWIGSAFVELNSGFYVHNVVLEAAMALGIPLALLFVALLATGLLLAWQLLASKNDLVALLFMQGLVAAVTSDSMYSSGLMWIGLLLMWQVSRRRRPEVAGTVPAPKPPPRKAATVQGSS